MLYFQDRIADFIQILWLLLPDVDVKVQPETNAAGDGREAIDAGYRQADGDYVLWQPSQRGSR